MVSASLLNGILVFVGHLTPKTPFVEEQQCYYLTKIWGDKGVHTFPKSISLESKRKITTAGRTRLLRGRSPVL